MENSNVKNSVKGILIPGVTFKNIYLRKTKNIATGDVYFKFEVVVDEIVHQCDGVTLVEIDNAIINLMKKDPRLTIVDLDAVKIFIKESREAEIKHCLEREIA